MRPAGADGEGEDAALSPMPLFKEPGRLQVPGRALPPPRGRHRVVAPFAQGVAPADAPGPQQDTLQAAVGHNGLDGIVAAAGGKPAAAADPGAEGVLIEADGYAQGPAAGLLKRAHGLGAGGSFRAGGTVAGALAWGPLALSGSPAWANSLATTLLTCQLLSLGVMARATNTRS